MAFWRSYLKHFAPLLFTLEYLSAAGHLMIYILLVQVLKIMILSLPVIFAFLPIVLTHCGVILDLSTLSSLGVSHPFCEVHI